MIKSHNITAQSAPDFGHAHPPPPPPPPGTAHVKNHMTLIMERRSGQKYLFSICVLKSRFSIPETTLRLVLLAGTNFSVLVVCCIWQVFILAFLR